jgi:Domain of unknown function (DUF4365)
VEEAKRDSLPRYPESSAEADRGVRLVQSIVGDGLEWIFRDESKVDFGIDAILEVVVNNEATGRLIAVQIKSGRSYFREPTSDDRGFVYRGEDKHLTYWLNHSLPVIVVICDPRKGTAFYGEITAANSRSTTKGWTTIIRRDQPFDVTARAELLRLANDPQKADLIELSLLTYLIDRWGDRLKIVNIFDLPRDWHWFPYMIEITGETGGWFAVGFIDTVLRQIDKDLLAEQEKWRLYNAGVTHNVDLMLFAVGDEPDTTRATGDVAAYLHEHPKIHWHRLVYEAPRELHEIDEKNRILWHMPGEDEPYHRHQPDGGIEAGDNSEWTGEEIPF